MDFSEFGLSQPILRAIADAGMETPTPIQALTIPQMLADRDLLACERAGSGKTAAFTMVLVNRLATRATQPGRRTLRVLVLTPDSDHAAQLEAGFVSYGRHVHPRRALVIGGGSSERQWQILSRGADVLVTTPRDLLELLRQRAPVLVDLETLVLDDTDRMCEMGFAPDLEAIASRLPARRQTLIFADAISVDVRKLSESLLTSPAFATASPPAAPQALGQRVYFVEKANKRQLLSAILGDAAIDRVLLFSRTRHGANRVVQHLSESGVCVDAIHGDISASARAWTLEAFASGTLRVLVVTDNAVRGLAIEPPSVVINYDLPSAAATYIDRLDRCSRTGASGQVLSFCESDERSSLRNIERLICGSIPVAVVPGMVPTANVAGSVLTPGAPTGASASTELRSNANST